MQRGTASQNLRNRGASAPDHGDLAALQQLLTITDDAKRRVTTYALTQRQSEAGCAAQVGHRYGNSHNLVQHAGQHSLLKQTLVLHILRMPRGSAPSINSLHRHSSHRRLVALLPLLLLMRLFGVAAVLALSSLLTIMPAQSVAARVSDSTTTVSPDSVTLMIHGPLDFFRETFGTKGLKARAARTNKGFVGNSTRTVSISKLYDLNFGGVFCGTSSGTVKVAPSGSVSYTGDVVAHTGVSGFLARQAVVQVNIANHDHLTHDDHEANDDDEYNRDEDDDDHTNDTHTSYTRHGTNVSITLPSSATLTRTGGTATMTADNFTFTRTKGTFNIGATLHVNGNQASGPYWGTFLVTVNCE